MPMPCLAPGCGLEVERGPGWLLVKIANLDDVLAQSVPLADQLWEVLERHFTYRLVLELDQVQILGSHLAGQLMELSRRIEQHGGVLRLCGLPTENRCVLQSCRLDDRFLRYHTREEAILGRTRPRQAK